MHYEHVGIENAIKKVCRIAHVPEVPAIAVGSKKRVIQVFQLSSVVSKAVEMTKNGRLNAGKQMSSKISSAKDIEECAGIPSIRKKRKRQVRGIKEKGKP
jgi:hypothetical protein